MKRSLLLLSLAALGASASASPVEITQVSSISATATEDFEGYSLYVGPNALFGGQVSVSSGESYYVLSQGDWGLITRSGGWTDVIPQSGSQFMAAGSGNPIRFGFGEGVYQFGGYFSNVFTQNNSFDLYVSDGNGGEVLADSFSLDLISEEGELSWAGFASNVALSSVVVSGYQMPMDDLVISTNAVPEPASMAALGLGGLALLRRRRKSA